ncbi:MAG: hypothetical protein KAG97_11265, partial [Victivallales bacterium]|nr:hypothetical protein [Victivallales bacterium]
TVSPLARGMRRAEPEAQMISWLYVPQFDDFDGMPLGLIKDKLVEIASHIPSDITFQYNFESMGETEQLGKKRMVLDYFLSWPGPSDIFSDCAKAAVENGASASAKIQVGCSHELATIPFIPVPGNLYKKYAAMRELGVSSVMQCWYFGNYPGLMNKAAGELSFEPFPENETLFLAKFAERDWGASAPKVVEAWLAFQESYSNFPVNLGFTHYGPLHHSIVWPLHLFPVDEPISPSWKFTFPLESGDRIGECICYDHTLEEALTLLDEMAELWGRGTEIFNSLRLSFAEDDERLLDIALANAINLQIDSAKNVFHFYALREELPHLSKVERMTALEEMRKFTLSEIENSTRMIELCEFDSRLGFHSEAEGYKYDPGKLESRISRLEKLLEDDFPKLNALIENDQSIFPEYTGEKPVGKRMTAASGETDSLQWEKIPGSSYTWTAHAANEELLFIVRGDFSENDIVTVAVEPRRLWPAQKFSVMGSGIKSQNNFKVRMDRNWSAKLADGLITISIPLSLFDGYRRSEDPLRVNVGVNENFWIERHPLEPRLRFSNDNPADLGWLFLPCGRN